MESLHLKHSGSTENYPQIEFINTGDGAHAGSIIFKKNGGSAADDDKLGRILLQGQDENSNTEDFAEITFSSSDVSDGSENGKIEFKTKAAGSTQELLTLESNKAILGGFLTPRLDLIFGEYAAAGTAGNATPRTDNYYGFIQTMSSLEGVVSVPYSAEDVGDINLATESNPTASYAINKPWGQNDKYYIQKIAFDNNNNPALTPSSVTPGTDYNFYHINGHARIGSNGPLTITVPDATANKILVFVVKATIEASDQDCVISFNTASEFDDNSLAIIANAPEIARKASGDTKITIVKDYTSNTAVKTKSRISGYIYFNPVHTADTDPEVYHYQVLGCLFASKPGNASTEGGGTLVNNDHDSVRFVFST